MSGKGKANNKSSAEKVVNTYTNPCFPGLLFKKVNGKDVVIGVKAKNK